MLTRNFHALETPLMGRTIALNKRLLEVSVLPSKKVQHEYVKPMLVDGSLLFRYAMRQLKGKDYKKRALELIEELQSGAYLVHCLGGWSKKVALSIDILCDEISEQITSESASFIKPKGEDECANRDEG